TRYQVNIFALGVHQSGGSDFRTPPGVAGAMRREQSVKAQLPAQGFIQHFDPGVNKQHGPMRVREYVLYEPIAALTLRIFQAVKEAIALRVLDEVIQVALFLVAKG